MDNFWSGYFVQPERLEEFERAIELFRPEARVRYRDWWTAAQLCASQVIHYILREDLQKAREYARAGTGYARTAVQEARVPTAALAPLTREEIVAGAYIALHTCSWLDTGDEDMDALESALRHLRVFAEDNLDFAEEGVGYRLRNSALLGLMAGDFEFAGRVAEAISEEAKPEELVRNPAALTRALALAFAHPTDVELTARCVRAVKSVLLAWNRGVTVELSGELDYAIRLSYLGAKFLSELRLDDWSLVSVVRRVRFGWVATSGQGSP